MTFAANHEMGPFRVIWRGSRAISEGVMPWTLIEFF